MTDHKSRIQTAIEKFSRKDDPSRPKRKNASPERDLQQEVLRWMNNNGFHVHNINSSASYSLAAGRYISQSHAAPGLPDIIGNDNKGHAVYIELKAKGKRSTLKPHQRQFLVNKIKTMCFAICADSIQMINDHYDQWLWTLEDECESFLLSLLPPERVQKDDDIEELFDE